MSGTGEICENLDVFGASFGPDDIDNRPLPEAKDIQTAVACLFEPIVGLFDASPLSGDLQSTLWGVVNTFHAQVNRLDSAIEKNERTQRDLRNRHDGSEIIDTQLCDATEAGKALISRRNTLLEIFDSANAEFEAVTGSTWQPWHGSRQRTKNMTAAMIDSKDFERARLQRWTEDNLPAGPYVVVAGGKQSQDVDAIWSRLDRVKEKHPSMTLLHGGAPGTDTIAAKWADTRGVTQIRYNLDRGQGQRAGFIRNEKMLATMPIGAITFPGNGLTEALKREARKLGVPVWDYETSQQTCGTHASSSSESEPKDDRPPAPKVESEPRKQNVPERATITEAKAAHLSPVELIDVVGVKDLAKHFAISEGTVRNWTRRGIPETKRNMIVSLATGQSPEVMT